ncbi:MAG: hypothetical protein P8P83_02680 [Rickettsiaceae bacterium]|nr:hypothetical protein [Rickettsiaceae bacterium]
MFKYISQFLIIIAASLYIALLFLLPFQWHKFGLYSEIFPAFDLIIIYYLCTHKKIKYWHLFLSGGFIDQLYGLPIGISSLMFILSYYGLKQLRRWFFLKDYITNITIFSFYSFVIILSRYLTVTIKSAYYIEGMSILFYFLTTIFSYPIMRILIEKPIQKICNYVR